jgi:hypothetical protein
VVLPELQELEQELQGLQEPELVQGPVQELLQAQEPLPSSGNQQ